MVKLKSGLDMPVLGLGTWQLTGRTCIETVKQALDMGYEHIDTAEAYSNQRDIGNAIKEFDRESYFLTSKVWRDNLRYDDVLKSCDKSLQELGTDYVDLLLVHWPNSSIPIEETLRAMKKLKDQGKIKAYGVSNFTIEHLKNVDGVEVNQVEFHPFLYQKKLLEYSKSNDIVVTAYSPLARGKVVHHPTLKEIGENHDKTAAQVSLRWLVQRGLIVIPKASSKEHLKENMEALDIELNIEEMAKIDAISENKRLVNPYFSEF